MPAPVFPKQRPILASTSVTPEAAMRLMAQAAPQEAWVSLKLNFEEAAELQLFNTKTGGPVGKLIEREGQRLRVYDWWPLSTDGSLSFWLLTIDEARLPDSKPLDTLRSGLRLQARHGIAAALLCCCLLTACEPPRPTTQRNLQPAPTPTVFDPDLAPLPQPSARQTPCNGCDSQEPPLKPIQESYR